VALGVLAYAVLSIRVSVPVLRSVSQRDRIWMVGSILLCVTLIPLLKQASSTSCPWSLVEFGGEATATVDPEVAFRLGTLQARLGSWPVGSLCAKVPLEQPDGG